MKVYVFWGTGDLGTELEYAVEANEEAAIFELDAALEDAEDSINAWVKNRQGKVMFSASTAGAFEVEPEMVRQLPQLCGLLDSISTLKFHFGVGTEIDDAHIAYKYAHKTGEDIALYDDDMRAFLYEGDEEEDPLLKSADSVMEQEDPGEVIMRALTKIRDNAEAIEQMKTTNPEAYESFRNITKAMIAMAKQIADVRQAAQDEKGEEKTEKSEQLLKTTPLTPQQSQHMGSAQNYENLGQQLQHMNHLKSERLGNGLYHHVFTAGPSQEIHGHTISTSKDPSDPHLAQLHGLKEPHGFQISTSAVNPQYQGKGFGKALYHATLAHHGSMLSDVATSGKADNAWRWLGSQPGIHLQMGQAGAPHVATMMKTEKLRKKMRLPQPKKTPKKIHMKYPDPLPAVADASGTVKDGKIKATSTDQATGAPRKTGWNSVRSGMIVGKYGSAVSSREPDTE